MEQVMTNYIRRALVIAIAAVAAACTITDTTPPPLAGPSGMSLSLAITASPDVLSQDGGSQSLITIEARDTTGQPVANQLLYLEIEGGDFGTLSSRSVVTNSQGRATFTYTAPAGTGADATENVKILVRPSGTDNAAELPRVVNIRLNPSGTIPTGAPSPSFTYVPEDPDAFIPVRFDGRASTPSRGATITNYSWDFGDGTSGTGATVSHTYSAPGSYGVRLTVTDSQGISATSAVQVITVEGGSPPTAAFVFSPTEPVAGAPVFFNGAISTPGPGHSIVRYRWNWGDGTATGSGSTVSHVFAASGSYIVVLTVTDEVGQTATASQTVDVQ
jgi:PKD repeat protein